jgi:hypothetical protein
MIQDTLIVIADSLPAALDTISAVVNPMTQIGSQVNAGVALLVGTLVKIAVDLTRKGVATLDTAPRYVKTMVAMAFAGVATWLSGVLGMPVSANLTLIDSTVASLVVAGVSMGVNAVAKTVKPSVS